MQSQLRARAPLGRRQEGIALIVTLMVLMLVSVLMVGFVAAIIADTRASGLDRDQTQAYAAAHAGLEQITSDLTALFGTDFSPSTTQINALTTNPPNLSGFSFIAPGGGSGSGYAVAPRFTSGGNPAPEDAVNGSTITSGPYQGFRGIITPYDITVTARSRGGAEVRMRRTLQTVAIPVFQFGMFSETDLAFHSGETYNMTGRVHTNGNLFLAQGTGNVLTIADRVTAVKQIVRTNLPNGLATSSSYGGTVRIPTVIASTNTYRNLALTEGSLQGTVPPAQTPQSAANPNWTKLSVGTYASNIRNGDTGAKKLDLPLVADRNNDGVPDAQPIELIRRPAKNSSEHTTNSFVYLQRFFAQASLRILLSDTAADIQELPTVLQTSQPIQLYGIPLPTVPLKILDYGVAAPNAMRSPIGMYDDPATGIGGTNYLPASVYKGQHNESVLNGFIKIEMLRQDGTYQDVTREILGLGISARNLSDANEGTPGNRWNKIPGTVPPAPIPPAGTGDICAEPHQDAVIRLQRVRDVPRELAPCGIDTNVSGNITGTVSAVSQDEHDYWPLALYDPREGHMRDGLSNTLANLTLGGVIHYVELDVRNLKRWLRGEIGANGTQARNDNGFIVYFSDRRNNRNAADNETGEYGWEDVVNAPNTDGAPNGTDEGTPEVGEDLNGNGTLQRYGRVARNVPGGALTPLLSTADVTSVISGGNTALIARANRPLFFRRALKLVNGQIYTNFTQGLTITSENPVYVQGDYNATAASTTAAGAVPSALIADAVTLLSNSWNDIRSFMSPGTASGDDFTTFPMNQYKRRATTTGYRMAVVSGKSLTFMKPSYADASFGSDGGAHNFLRTLEDWTATGTALRYRGSLVSFFTSRQAVGTFKCCDYDVYDKPDIRDFAFDTDFLLPSRLPPGTPMFRDVNTLTFRQLLRPTQ